MFLWRQVSAYLGVSRKPAWRSSTGSRIVGNCSTSPRPPLPPFFGAVAAKRWPQQKLFSPLVVCLLHKQVWHWGNGWGFCGGAGGDRGGSGAREWRNNPFFPPFFFFSQHYRLMLLSHIINPGSFTSWGTCWKWGRGSDPWNGPFDKQHSEQRSELKT